MRNSSGQEILTLLLVIFLGFLAVGYVADRLSSTSHTGVGRISDKETVVSSDKDGTSRAYYLYLHISNLGLSRYSCWSRNEYREYAVGDIVTVSFTKGGITGGVYVTGISPTRGEIGR